MIQASILALWAIFIHFALSAKPAGSPEGLMARWSVTKSDGSINPSWSSKPTFYAQYPSSNVAIRNPETYEANMALAQSHFNWLVDPANANQNLESELGWIVVAIFYDPVSKWHWVSTVPRGPRWGWMINSVSAAPKWYAAATEGFADSTNQLSLHAEHGAYYNFETSNLRTVQQNGIPYPHGSIVAAYGGQRTRGSNTWIRSPSNMALCSTGSSENGKKFPPCQQVAMSLGVQFTRDRLTEDTDAHSDNEFPIDDDTLEAMCDLSQAIDGQGGQSKRESHLPMIRGRTVPFPKRNASAVAACGTTFSFGPTPVSTFSYTGTVSSVSSTKPTSSSTTKASTISCLQQFEAPDEGINTEYCVCEGSRTLPFLTVTDATDVEASCAYTTLPPKDTKRSLPPRITLQGPEATGSASLGAARSEPRLTARKPLITPSPTLDKRDLTISTGFGPPTTDTKNCRVCSQDSPWGQSCATVWTLPGCVRPTGQVTLEAGTSSLHVGTVTGTVLYTAVSGALSALCPTPTANEARGCDDTSATFGGVPYVDSSGLLETDGKIVVTVESSSYNDSQILEALVKTAATALQAAAQGKNCYTAEYSVLEARAWTPWNWFPSMYRRDHPYEAHESATWCNSVGFAGPHYYNPWWKLQSHPGASDYIDAHFEFHEGSGGDFFCDVLEDAVDALVLLAPEFAVADIELGEAIKVACDCADGNEECPV